MIEVHPVRPNGSIRRLRVALIVSNFHRLHGVAVYYRNLVPLLRRDVDLTVITTDIGSPECDLPVRSWGWRAPARAPEVDWLLPQPGGIEDALSSLRPDIVHATDHSPLGLLALRAARRFGICSALTHHTDLAGFMRTNHQSPIFVRCARALASAASRNATAIAALGPLGIQLAAATYGVPSDRIQQLSPGVSLDLFSPSNQSRPQGRPLQVLTVSRLSAEKRIDLVIDACHGLLDRIDLDLVVVGRGPQRRALEARARQRVMFRGSLGLEDLASEYQRSDLFVLASPAEIFPQVLLEAQASGLPSIVSPSGGSRQAITDMTGAVADGDNPDAFGRAIERLTSDPVGIDAMKDHARTHAANYTWDRAATELIAWYGSLHMRSVPGTDLVSPVRWPLTLQSTSGPRATNDSSRYE